MFEPRGHDMMSGSILYPPTRPTATSPSSSSKPRAACRCAATAPSAPSPWASRTASSRPRTPGRLSIDAPAGKFDIEYRQEGRFVEEVRLTNVPAFLHAEGLTATVEGLGEIVVDVAYGGNFYAIVEPQKNFATWPTIRRAN